MNDEQQNVPPEIPRIDTPRFPDVLRVFGLSAGLLLTVGMMLQDADIINGLLMTEFIFLASPAILYAMAHHYHLPRTFHLVPIHLKTVLLTIISTLAAFVLIGVSSYVQEAVFPLSQEYQEFLQLLIKQFRAMPLIMSIGVFAVVPGICEEILFRGFLLRGLRNSCADWAAVLLVGITFGAFHLDPYKLLATTLLGIFFGYLVVKTGSIFTGMIAHITNNSIVILLSSLANIADEQAASSAAQLADSQFSLEILISLFSTSLVAAVVLFFSLRALPSFTRSNQMIETSLPL